MLKTVSSITNAIGALNFKGTWDAATNTPTIVSGVGVKGDYFVVSVAGSTTIDGLSNWGVGDWITYNGTVWQRVEGGADLNGVNLSVSGTTNLAGLTASTSLALDASKNVVSVTNTGSGNNVLATSPTLTTPNIGAATGSSLVLGTPAGTTSILQTKLAAGSEPVYYCQHHSNANATWYMIRFFNGAGSAGGGILQNTSTGVINYATSSDYRLKTNVIELGNAVDRLKQLKPVRFKWLATPDGNLVDGFIAHEAQEVVPDAVNGEKDAVNEDGSINPQGIDQSKLVPLLTAALQDAIRRIEILEQGV